MSDTQKSLKYAPSGPVVQEFLNSHEFIRGIMGPLGSGKSSACVIEILRRASEQTPNPIDGIRYTRFAVIRNSYPELRTTTIKTYFQWVPQEFGKYTQDSPIIHHIRAQGLDCEILFLALDKEDDAKKLLSLELTGAWINEAREINKGIVDMLSGRVGRYPSKNMGGCTWSGIFMDTNPCDDQCWWYKAAEELKPEGWKFFKQPSGRSASAENLANLPQDYYKRIASNKDDDWIRVYVDGEYGYVTEGKAVYPMFKDSVHVAKEKLEPVENVPLLLGCDLGLTPAAVIAQKLIDGRWIILDEFITEQCGHIRFSELLKSYIARNYPKFRVDGAWCDPAGRQKSFSDERTSIDILKTYTGYRWMPAQTNDLTPRREVVVAALNRLIDGSPGFLLSPKCFTLRKAMSGGYHFKFVKASGGTQMHETPNKNGYSHIAEAVQYLMLGGGEYSVMLNRQTSKERQGAPRQKLARDLDYDLFDSGGRR